MIGAVVRTPDLNLDDQVNVEYDLSTSVLAIKQLDAEAERVNQSEIRDTSGGEVRGWLWTDIGLQQLQADQQARAGVAAWSDEERRQALPHRLDQLSEFTPQPQWNDRAAGALELPSATAVEVRPPPLVRLVELEDRI